MAAIGLLGSGLAGAAAGGGAAVQENSQAQEKELIQQQMEIATEMRHMSQAASIRDQVITPIMKTEVPQVLAENKQVMTQAELQSHIAAGDKDWTVAKPIDIQIAQSVALGNHGWNPDQVQKIGGEVSGAKEKGEDYILGYSAGNQNRAAGTVKAAEVGAGAKNHATDTRSSDAAAKMTNDLMLAKTKYAGTSAVQAQKMMGEITFGALPLTEQSAIRERASQSIEPGSPGAIQSTAPAAAPVSWNSLQP
jgi:hypothetical protein